MFRLTDIEELVDQLNTTIWRLDNNDKVFDGKCCFISYCIAKNLEERDILYNVIVYAHAGSNTEDVFQLLEEENIAHVSIRLSLGNKKFIIGDNLIDDNGLEVSYHNFNSEELLNLYENGNWNTGHSDITDEEIKDEIDMTFMMVL